MQVQFSKTSGNRNRVSGFLRLFVLSLLTAAFSFTSLHAQTVAYVTSDDGTVSVIDTSTNTVITTIGAGNGAAGVVVSPDGARAYVTNEFDSTISVIDTASNTVAATIGVGSSPGFTAITPDGKSLYVPSFLSDNVQVVSTASNTVTATIPTPSRPFAVAITPDGLHAYVLSQNAVSVIDTSTNTVVGGPILVFAFPPIILYPGIAITPAGNAAYVSGVLAVW